MENRETVDELYRLLRPYIGEYTEKKDAVYEENVRGMIEFAVDFQVAEKLLERVKLQPDTPFWEFFRQMVDEDIPQERLMNPPDGYVLDDELEG